LLLLQQPLILNYLLLQSCCMKSYTKIQWPKQPFSSQVYGSTMKAELALSLTCSLEGINWSSPHEECFCWGHLAQPSTGSHSVSRCKSTQTSSCKNASRNTGACTASATLSLAKAGQMIKAQNRSGRRLQSYRAACVAVYGPLRGEVNFHLP
jgi:hypothetical protein